MRTVVSVVVYDINENPVISEYVKQEELDDFIMKIPAKYDAGDVQIDNKWFYVDELKDITRIKRIK